MTRTLPCKQVQENQSAFNLEHLLSRKPIQTDHESIRQQISDADILITGAAGSIGSELAMQVCQFNPRCLILVDQSETLLTEVEASLQIRFPHIKLATFIADITDPARMEHVFKLTRPKILFHAAAYKHVPVMEKHPYEAVRTNVFGTKLLADLAVRYGVSQFIFISTDKAVIPASVMGATKRLAELYIRQTGERSKTKFTITRFGNVLGSSGSFIIVFQRQIEAGGPVTVTHPKATRYLMTPNEACQLVLQATSPDYYGKLLFFDMGEPVSVRTVAEQMITLKKLTPHVDICICYTGLRPGEKLHEDLLNDDETEIPASHPGMRIAVSDEVCSLNFEIIFANLSTALKSGSPNEIIAALKQILPEYGSIADRVLSKANAGFHF
ncbi:UDP-N-acetylglucosamine 4,6-dehydratase [Dyadobacter crusticola]|uniref:UDP-N-acetylglucosamine 4,6-dehydratase n=1 Tax=Dyadobacter crusticola TaxID=292407 RepID=UPI00068C23CA|nr:polysaccharide biosynthesis protein [Dyadobacter crusticola]